MEIRTQTDSNFDVVHEKLMIDLPDYAKDYHKRWSAYISGPWYDDSDIEGTGDTEQEAIDNAFKKLMKLYQEAGDFLRKHGKLSRITYVYYR